MLCQFANHVHVARDILSVKNAGNQPLTGEPALPRTRWRDLDIPTLMTGQNREAVYG
jgi:hypothetical protein